MKVDVRIKGCCRSILRREQVRSYSTLLLLLLLFLLFLLLLLLILRKRQTKGWVQVWVLTLVSVAQAVLWVITESIAGGIRGRVAEHTIGESRVETLRKRSELRTGRLGHSGLKVLNAGTEGRDELGAA